MTEAEQAELKQCSHRLAELLYKEACEEGRPVSSLAMIESTIRTQLQEQVSPTIGIFFAKPSAALEKDTLGPLTACLEN